MVVIKYKVMKEQEMSDQVFYIVIEDNKMESIMVIAPINVLKESYVEQIYKDVTAANMRE